MSKKILALVLSIATVISLFPTIYASKSDYKTTEAAYGTPIIDGSIDEVWDKANYNVIENCRTTQMTEYKGWFKVLWDEGYLYVLAKIYDRKCENIGADWVNDSVDVYIDEDNKRAYPWTEDDYQLRCAWDSVKSGSSNYGSFDAVDMKASLFDNGFIAEMSIPFKKEKITENMEIGFDVQANAAEELGVEMRCYTWNNDIDGTWYYNKPSTWGTLILRKTVTVEKFDEPEWIPAKAVKGYSETETPVKYELMESQTVSCDNLNTTHSILLADDYPLMEINELGEVIGASVKDDTISKDDQTIRYIDGERLAEYNGGHLMLEREPVKRDGKLYVPVSSIVPTMLYTTHYNRFGNILNIWSGTVYPESEITFYARDFGAVGDGVTVDGPAITRALNAAMNSGKPATVELDEGKEYFLGERIDSYSYFLFENVDNITFDCKGSTLWLKNATNTFVDISNCANIKIKDANVRYKEAPSTWGWITSVDKDTASYVLDIPEGNVLPCPDDWCWARYTDTAASRGGWWFGQPFEKDVDRLVISTSSTNWIRAMEQIGERQFRVYLKYERELFGEVGQRFVINTRASSYDVGTDGMTNPNVDQGTPHQIHVTKSGDIVFDGVKVHGSPHFGAGVGLCWGRVTFRNWGMLTDDGNMLAANSDGIHYYRCRGGLVVENSLMENNFDDEINTKGETSDIVSKTGERTYLLSKDMMYRQGDELLFFDNNTHTLLGNAFIEDVSIGNGGWNVKIDRDIDGVITNADGKGRCTLLYNIDNSGRGSVIRNNTFKYSRRHAYITRSQNSIFMNNKVIECGGSAVIAKNEIFTSNSEGPFPSSFTMRDNYVTTPKTIQGYYPVEVKSWNAKIGDTAAIDGFLMENNTIKGAPNGVMIRITHAQDVYMLNNNIICTSDVAKDEVPVAIMGSEVKKIDGLNIDFKTDVDYGLVFVGCKIDKDAFGEIDTNSEITQKYDVR